MKKLERNLVYFSPQQALRIAHSLCNHYSIPIAGHQFVALVGNGYEQQNIDALQSWVKKQSVKVINKSDISEWVMLLKSDLKCFGVELMD
ncbi:hypothetical protein [Photobacterium sanguinicancri]|uniref:hypothetical protein n=1 Tax=Photobacterium sanguinicancri TaxID=875932 RepID=UPI003D0A0EAC